MTDFQCGGITLHRMSYLDLPVPAELLGLTESIVREQDWAVPDWAEEGQVKIGAAAWCGKVAETPFVLDPVQAVDVVLRADPDTEAASEATIAERFADAGYARESIGVVLMTHIEGVGMVAAHTSDGWFPYFPHARILVSRAQIDAFNATDPGRDDPEYAAWRALIDGGFVDTFADGDEVLPGIIAEVTGCHGPGHTVFHLDADGPDPLIFIGHLAVSPVHLATGPCEALNGEPEATSQYATEIAGRGQRMIGPLWPAPGVGRWSDGRLVAEKV